MPTIVVGGQAKDIGKTTLVCNIVAAFPERSWTAAKISDHRHRVSGCKLVGEGDGWSILEQVERKVSSDTARYLLAGARRALLVQAEGSALRDASNTLLQFCSGNLIIESNRALEFLSPDLFLLVVDDEREFKPSAQAQLRRAHALVSRGRRGPSMAKPSFPAMQNGLDSRLVALIRARLD